MEKTWGKNGGTYKTCNYGLLFINLYSPGTLFKTLKGEMVTTLNQQHIPI